MKKRILLLFSLLLLSSFLASSRLLEPPKGARQGEKEVKMNDYMEELMGPEKCYEKDEECYSRRMMAEAHLDYIYTQHHKP